MCGFIYIYICVYILYSFDTNFHSNNDDDDDNDERNLMCIQNREAETTLRSKYGVFNIMDFYENKLRQLLAKKCLESVCVV